MIPGEGWDSCRHDLRAGDGAHAPIALAPLPAQAAEGLSARFAAMDPWAAYGYPASGLAAYLRTREPGAPRFAIAAGGNLAGVAGLRLAWLKGPYLQFLAVLPEFQGQGVGGAFLEWLDREARAGLGPNVWVCVSEINARGRLFYERHGFTLTATLEGLVIENRAELLLRKRL